MQRGSSSGGTPLLGRVKKLDLPRSYVQQGERITALLQTHTMLHGAILDLVGSTGRSLWAELFRDYLRRGVPPPPIRGVKKLDLPRSYVPRAV